MLALKAIGIYFVINICMVLLWCRDVCNGAVPNKILALISGFISLSYFLLKRKRRI